MSSPTSPPAEAAAPPGGYPPAPWTLPYLAALCLALNMLVSNIGWLIGLSVVWPLLLALVAAMVIDGVSRLLLRRVPTRALAAAVVVFWFFGYGNFDAALNGHIPVSQGTSAIIWSVALLSIAALACIAADVPLVRIIGRVMNISLVVLIVMQVGNFSLQMLPDLRFDALAYTEPKEPAVAVPANTLPDIYYIIPDTYPRADVLQRDYHFDNLAFLNELRARQFFVADRARSNYGQTGLSLASSLNMMYLDQAILEPCHSRIPLMRLITDSRVIRELKRQGYKTITTSSGYSITEDLPFDEQAEFPPGRSAASVFPPANEFQLYMLGSLAGSNLLQPALKDAHRARNQYALATAPKLRQHRDGPVFVLAHVLLPHPPFLFDPSGAPVDNHLRYMSIADRVQVIPPGQSFQQAYATGYVGQLRYTNQLLLQAIDGILAASDRPVVIIIQGDTGPCSHGEGNGLPFLVERFANLNAIRLPPGQTIDFPPDLTPVNTFRYLCDHFLGTHYGILPNKCFTASYATPYQFEDVTDRTLPPGE